MPPPSDSSSLQLSRGTTDCNKSEFNLEALKKTVYPHSLIMLEYESLNDTTLAMAAGWRYPTARLEPSTGQNTETNGDL